MFIDGLLVNVYTNPTIFFPPGNVLDIVANFSGCHRNGLKNGIGDDYRKFLSGVNKNRYSICEFRAKLYLSNNIL